MTAAGHTDEQSPVIPPLAGGQSEPAAEPPAESALDQAVRERDEFRDDLQRLAAEFDNYRKRMQRELDAARRVADDRLLIDLLGVLDDIDRAVQMTPDSAEHEGFAMVRRRFYDVVAKAGLSEVDVAAGFNPQLHEAILVQAGTGQPEGAIVEVAQKGYQVDGRVVRHAKVVVAGEQ